MKDCVLEELFRVISDRKENPSENSYTCYLFSEGLDKILKKVGEEASETIIAAKNADRENLVGELSDLIYHLLVLCAQQNLPLDEVLAELARRSEKIGNLKQKHQSNKES